MTGVGPVGRSLEGRSLDASRTVATPGTEADAGSSGVADAGSSGVADAGSSGVADAARSILDAHWRPTPGGGFCVPHASVYPWQWLWDSCFHAVVWAHLGDERAVAELRSVFDAQDPSGFVPHVNYRGDHRHDAFWGRAGTSCLTQPPMYGHAASVLVELGLDPGAEVLAKAQRGLRHLLRDRPRHESGLVALLHPWESGADDSPRWDDWCGDRWTSARWYEVKGELVAALARDADGAGRANPGFDVASVGFNALLADGAREVAGLTGDDELLADADEVATILGDRWAPGSRTWVDAGRAPGAPPRSGGVRTLDALLVALVAPTSRAREVLGDALDDDAYGGRTGPAGVHRSEPTFDPTGYWRGAAWPQVTYLLWVAAGRHGLDEHRDRLGRALVAGAVRSGFAEYWHPDRGSPGGAAPQSWAALAVVAAGGT